MLSNLSTTRVTSFSVVFVLCFSIQLERMAKVFESNRLAKESKIKVISELNYNFEKLLYVNLLISRVMHGCVSLIILCYEKIKVYE